MLIRGWPRTIAWSAYSEVDAPPNGEDGQTFTFTPFSFRYSGTRRDRTGWRLEGVTVKVSLNKSQSWIVKGKQHRDLLKHEQDHYDITGLAEGRELFNKLTELPKKSLRINGASSNRKSFMTSKNAGGLIRVGNLKNFWLGNI